MKKVRKAIIPAAGYGTRFLPATKSLPKEMLPIIDKPTIQYIIEEALSSGIEEILVITSAQKRAIEDHFDRSYELEDILDKKGKNDDLKLVKEISNLANIHYVRQKEQLGLGHAVLCAKTFVGDEPFAVLLGDDIVYNGEGKPALKQLIDEFTNTKASVVGVQEVKRSEVNKYGIVVPSKSKKPEGRLIKLSDMVEKPKVEETPSNLAVLGRYVLTPEIFELLETQERGAGGEIQLTDSIKRLVDLQAVYAYDFVGKRYDVGHKIGYLEATIDFALRRDDLKEEVYKMLDEKVTTKK